MKFHKRLGQFLIYLGLSIACITSILTFVVLLAAQLANNRPSFWEGDVYVVNEDAWSELHDCTATGTLVFGQKSRVNVHDREGKPAKCRAMTEEEREKK